MVHPSLVPFHVSGYSHNLVTGKQKNLLHTWLPCLAFVQCYFCSPVLTNGALLSPSMIAQPGLPFSDLDPHICSCCLVTVGLALWLIVSPSKYSLFCLPLY